MLEVDGNEFISKAMDKCDYERGVEIDFGRPGKPTDNARVETLNGKMGLIKIDDDLRATVHRWPPTKHPIILLRPSLKLEAKRLL